MGIRFRIGIAGVLALACSSALASDTDNYVRQLPSAPTLPAPRADRLYTQHKVDLDGQSVTLIDVLDGTGGWERPDSSHLPPDRTHLAPSSRSEFQRFFGPALGWMLVPAGWRLLGGGIGADGGSSYTYMAPGGVTAGWLEYDITPSCQACVLGGADGLLPGAWKAEVALGYVHGAKPWKPVPTPQRLDHPNACTALLRYQSGGLTVHGTMLSPTPMGPNGASSVEVYAALPSTQSTVGRAIVASLRSNYPACAGFVDEWNLPN